MYYCFNSECHSLSRFRDKAADSRLTRHDDGGDDGGGGGAGGQ